MKWDTIQQLIRIVMYAIGGAVFGHDVADGELYQGAIGGAIAFAAFVWWFFKQRQPTN